MKTIVLTMGMVVLSAGLFAPSFATNMQGIYLNGNIGVTQCPEVTFEDPSYYSLSLSSKIGVAGGLALGLQNDSVRVELATNYWENKANINQNLDILAGAGSIALAMMNGYYDFSPEESFTPYLGLGVGVAHFSSSVLCLNDTHLVHHGNNNIAYQAIVGVAFNVAPHLKASADYRYLISGSHEVSVSQSSYSVDLRNNYQNHRVSLSLSYYLN